MKQRYFIYLSYNGKNYHGWQIQPNGISVQEVLVNALATVLRYEVEVIGAGRTDAGVHAKLMVAHVDLKNNLKDANAFMFKLNSLLPHDIAIEKIVSVKPDAHARFDAVSRTYEYYVIGKKDPFLSDWATRIYGDIDFAAMNQAAKALLEYSDFTSFSKLHTDVKTNNCKITRAEWKQKEELWVFTIQADRFLRNMVRAIVGSLLEVGKGRIDEEGFCRIIEARDRCRAGTSVPAQALYLTEVKYSDDLYLIG